MLRADEFKPKDFEAVRHRLRDLAAGVKVTEWQPTSRKAIAVDETEAKQQAEAPANLTDEDEQVVERLLKELPPPLGPDAAASKGVCNVVDFEKDDDRNFHIDLIHAAANIRADQYKIKTVDRLQSKLIAGKIIPAIVTTTASVTGLVCLEFYKLLAGKKLEQYRNTFVNLALPVFQQSEPVPPKKSKFAGKEFTIWERIDVRLGDITLEQCLKHLKDTYNLDVDILGVGASLIFSGWMPAPKKKERLGRKLSDLVVEITKQPLKKGQRHLGVEVTGTIDEADVDVPPITLWI